MTRAVLDAAPEIAAADDDAHLNAHLGAALDSLAYAGDKIEVEAGLFLAGKGLAAYFNKYSFIHWFRHGISPLSNIKYAHNNYTHNHEEDRPVVL